MAGIVNAAYGISSTIWSQVQLAIANPDNVEAVEETEGGDAFFVDESVLERVPMLIYTMATMQALLLTIGKSPELFSQICLYHVFRRHFVGQCARRA